MCEEFNCLPAEAIDALENDVGGLIFKILDIRSYLKAKQIYDSTSMNERPKTPAMDKVSEITMGLARERIERLKIKE